MSCLRTQHSNAGAASNCNRILCKPTVETLICSAASDLGMHCLPMSHKKDPRLIWVKVNLCQHDKN